MQNSSEADALYARLSARVRALAFDMAVYATVMVVLMILDATPSAASLAQVNGVVFLALIFLYEPLLVWRFGGTLGHIRQNLRIVADRTGGNPGFAASFVRWFVKGSFGLLSFALMMFTRRHQALHDAASRTTVQVRDPRKVRSADFVVARPDPPAVSNVSAGRRAIVVLLWEVLLLVVLASITSGFASEACIESGRCSEGEDLLLSLAGTTWLVLAGATLVLGWMGRLPGARRLSKDT